MSNTFIPDDQKQELMSIFQILPDQLKNNFVSSITKKLVNQIQIESFQIRTNQNLSENEKRERIKQLWLNAVNRLPVLSEIFNNHQSREILEETVKDFQQYIGKSI